MWTLADVEALPEDGNRYEILYGELLVTPLPATEHQAIAASLTALLLGWCRKHTGWAVWAPGGVYISETKWLEPDVAVYAFPHHTRAPWRELAPPILVAEVLSPSTVKIDRHRKRPEYLAHGVTEVWLINGDTRTIERWTAASELPEVFRGSIRWQPNAALPSLLIAEEELFGPAAT